MSRSKARLAADWFAKLRINATTQAVEHADVATVEEEVVTLSTVDVVAKLDASSYTAADVLTKIKTVDGASSGLDADLLDGNHASAFSLTSHNHTLDSLSNTTITSNTSGEILKWNGTAWINNTLAEAGIQPAGSYLTTTGKAADSDLLDGIDSSAFVRNNNGAQSIAGDLTLSNGSVLYTQKAASSTTGGTAGIETKNGGGTGDSALAAIAFHCEATYATHLHLRNDGYFGAGGWSASSWRWYVYMPNGDMTAAGNVTAYSDERLKDNVAPLENALDKVLSLDGVSFTWKNLPEIVGRAGQNDLGILAQQVEAVAPEAVSASPHISDDGDPYKTVAYDKLVPLLIEAIKEQQAQIDELKAKLGV